MNSTISSSVFAFCLLFCAAIVPVKPYMKELEQLVLSNGLNEGVQIPFYYYGSNLARVTLSIEDSIGKGLHFELRHNEKCKGNPPELRLNTYENGKYGKREVVKLTEIEDGSTWTVTVQKEGYFIEQPELGVSYLFAYRPPHKLSDITKVKLYADDGCGSEKDFSGVLKLYQEFPEFSKIEVVGSNSDMRSGNAVYVKFSESSIYRVLLYAFNRKLYAKVYSEGNTRYGTKVCYKRLSTSVTPATKLGMVLEYHDDTYWLTLSAGDQESTCNWKAAWIKSLKGSVKTYLKDVSEFKVE